MKKNDIGLIKCLDIFAEESLSDAKDRGFWHEGDNKNIYEVISFIMAELAECVEAVKDGNKESLKINGFSQLEEELSDIIIFIMHMSKNYNLNVPEALIKKKNYNKTRPYRHEV